MKNAHQTAHLECVFMQGLFVFKKGAGAGVTKEQKFCRLVGSVGLSPSLDVYVSSREAEVECSMFIVLMEPS